VLTQTDILERPPECKYFENILLLQAAKTLGSTRSINRLGLSLGCRTWVLVWLKLSLGQKETEEGMKGGNEERIKERERNEEGRKEEHVW